MCFKEAFQALYSTACTRNNTRNPLKCVGRAAEAYGGPMLAGHERWAQYYLDFSIGYRRKTLVFLVNRRWGCPFAQCPFLKFQTLLSISLWITSILIHFQAHPSSLTRAAYTMGCKAVEKRISVRWPDPRGQRSQIAPINALIQASSKTMQSFHDVENKRIVFFTKFVVVKALGFSDTWLEKWCRSSCLCKIHLKAVDFHKEECTFIINNLYIYRQQNQSEGSILKLRSESWVNMLSIDVLYGLLG